MQRSVLARLSLQTRIMPSRALRTTAIRKSHEAQVDASQPPMLRYQTHLPELPVPELANTARRYLDSVRALVSPTEYAKTEAAVASFVQSDHAKQLQQRLKDRAATPGIENWLADWWNDVAYMGYRDPVVVFVSYFYVHVEDSRRSQAERAARLVKAMLPFRDMTESGQLEPEKARHTPLCMASYKWLFNAARFPVKPSDTATKFDPATNNHVVFVRKNRFFEFDVTGLSTADLAVQIQRIIDTAGREPAPHPVGALTSENRDTWTDARAHLAKNPKNAAALKRIDSAIVVVALDDTAPVTRDDVSWGCWVGDGKNRWYDKQQFIVFENGKSGFLGEHSCMDGTTTLRLNEFMLASLAHGKIDHGSPSPASTLKAPKEITFDLDSTTKSQISTATQNFNSLVSKHDLHVLHYEGYGKSAIKHYKASPDAWAQLVKQLAFHKMFGRPGVCYESCQTRKFKRGRTEVIRSASVQSGEWSRAMLDPNVDDITRHDLFRAAIKHHLTYAQWAADGQGVDRHLFGLKQMLKPGEPTPDIYTDPSYGRSNHWELSTSQLSSDYFDGWGYGEVVPDGYGLSYSIADDYIRWTVTSLKKDSATLKHYLAEAATETKQMMDRAAKAIAARDAHKKA
ncbi:Carnitine O-acetyltransferase [Ceratobasidium theobromae]|uniref:Carnitine O-acetyltransferase, mitochondrial n=1 Tax=Ceratobasidium theobromae TaxID=1582974 RepID=A0A5N5QB78_9AGAM|nr:Carnitine O-acetyltransferase [Ceratobasidium theobromae]